MEKRKLYAGLDIGTRYAMISYYMLGMSEPETVSRIAGGEVYQIPQLLYKREGIGQWFYGEEAAKTAKKYSDVPLDKLYLRARDQESVVLDGQSYTYVELFALFIRKMLMLAAKLNPNVQIEQLVLTTDSLNRENMKLFAAVMEKLDIAPGHFTVIDYPESFYYYALSQKRELWLHDTAMFDYGKSGLLYFYMERKPKTTPQLVSVMERNLGQLEGDKDLVGIARGVWKTDFFLRISDGRRIRRGVDAAVAEVSLPEQAGISWEKPLYQGGLLCGDGGRRG